ncbi:CDP-alcohol phosphatidyltransferase family protein [bacterium]|nr:CDP-alcohol phosphatidyltransferase family protein [bacterium]
MLYRFKARFQKLAQGFAQGGMSANQASLAGAICVALSLLCLGLGRKASWLLWIHPVILLARFIFNALDGLLARQQNTASAAGEIFNELSDVGGDTLTFLAFYFLFPQNQLLVVGLLISIWFCEFVAVLGKSLPGGLRRQESVGGGKPERAVWLGLFSLAWAAWPETSERAVPLFLALLTLLVLLSGLRRIQAALHAARGQHYTSQTQYGQ